MNHHQDLKIWYRVTMDFNEIQNKGEIIYTEKWGKHLINKSSFVFLKTMSLYTSDMLTCFLSLFSSLSLSLSLSLLFPYTLLSSLSFSLSLPLFYFLFFSSFSF